MESVQNKERICSVFLLWDDRGASAFHLRVFWLKIFGTILILLLAWAVFSGYFVYSYTEKYIGLSTMRSETERLSAETQRKLAHLTNMELKLENQQKLLITAGVCAARDLGIHTAEAATPAAPAAQAPAAAVLSDAPAAPQAETPHPAKRTNLAVRALDSVHGHISFDLSNEDEQLTLNGRISLTAITNTGQAAEITQADHKALSFRIRRYKKISAAFTLPPDINMADVAFVELRLSGDNVPPYSERVPINNA